jgi:alpha/beta superfamily hydrolase
MSTATPGTDVVDSQLPTRVDPATGVIEEAAFTSGAERLLTVTHLPQGQLRGALLVCPELGWGFTKNYRREVLLARRLAEAGWAVQRFHPRGVGESGGRFEDTTFDRLVGDAMEAADLLAGRTGQPPTAVLGSRLGAAVGLEVASRLGGVPLVAWDPIGSGRSYVRDLARLRGTWRLAMGDDEPVSAADELDRTGYLDVVGYRVSRRLHDQIAEMSLGELGADHRPPQALLLHIGRRADTPPRDVRAVADELRGSGTEVDVAGVEGRFDWWLRKGFDCEEASPVGRALITRTVSWLAERASTLKLRDDQPVGQPRPPAVDAPAATVRPVFFPAGRETLFGVLAEPDQSRSDIGVIMLSGGDYQLTSGLFGVWSQLADRLAERGLTSLRMSFRGIAESTGTCDDFDLSKPFTDDLVGASEFLVGRGIERVVLVGRCFGGRTAIAADPTGVLGVAMVAVPLRVESLKESVVTRAEHQLPMDAGSIAQRLRRGDVRQLLSDPDRRRRALRRVTSSARFALARLRGPRAVDAALGWVNGGLVDDLEAMTGAGVPVELVHGHQDRGDYAAAQAGRLGALTKDPARSLREVVIDTPNVMFTPDALSEELARFVDECVEAASD